MANSIDRYMSRLNERLMSCAQRALDEMNYLLDDMNNIAEQHPEREDILSCIEEIKAKNKKAVTESWATANHWSEHFDGLSTEDAKEEESVANEEENKEVDDGSNEKEE